MSSSLTASHTYRRKSPRRHCN